MAGRERDYVPVKWVRSGVSAIVHFAPMTDSRNFDEELSVVDGLDNTVIANWDVPLAVSAVQFLAAPPSGNWRPTPGGVK